MSEIPIVVVRTGTANTASVMAALRRIGGQPKLSQDSEVVRRATRVVLPGVGSFGAARAALRGQADEGLDAALRARIEAGRATLGICLGMQLLATGSEEDPEGEGLGLLPGRVRRFADGVIRPQLGWNQVEAGPECRLLQSGEAYFANSYRLDPGLPGWACATAEHGGPFLAACERGAVLACQFHPELSGAWGQSLLARWARLPQSAEVPGC